MSSKLQQKLQGRGSNLPLCSEAAFQSASLSLQNTVAHHIGFMCFKDAVLMLFIYSITGNFDWTIH